MTNIQQVRCFYLCDGSTNSTESEALRDVGRLEGGQTQVRNSNTHWSSTKCHFQDLERVFRLEMQADMLSGQSRRRTTTPNENR